MMLATKDPHKGQPVVSAGAPFAEAKAAMVLIHGRGASAEDILSLAEYFARDDVAYVAPQAAGNAWYPNPFMSPIERNEPYLTSALNLIDDLVGSIEAEAIPVERIVLLGFSQGGCLSLEFAARNARRYGGVVAFSGGLVGATIRRETYRGDFSGAPIFLGVSDRDPHIPLTRVQESSRLVGSLGAKVDERVYPGMGHTVNEEEVAWVRALLDVVVGSEVAST